MKDLDIYPNWRRYLIFAILFTLSVSGIVLKGCIESKRERAIEKELDASYPLMHSQILDTCSR